jgi:hypothetical protein
MDFKDKRSQIMDESKLKLYKNVIKGSAILLCLLFFTLPLVQCSQDSSVNASGWEIATGTGNLFRNNSGYPLAFLLLIIPVVLLIQAFTNKSFKLLRNTSIAGLSADIIFLIYANSLLNSGEYRGAFKLTGSNWLLAIIYIGLCALTYYCAKEGYSGDISIVPEGERYKVITNTKIRSGPQPDSIEKITLNVGDTICFKNFLEDDPNWCYVKTTDLKVEGWCLSEHLEKC